MVFPLHAATKAALDGSYELASEVWVLRDPPVRVPASTGVVNASYQSQVARDATFTTDRGALTPSLSTLTDKVMIRVGVKDVEMVPIFTGRVDEISENEFGALDVSCVDAGMEVVRAKFEVPWSTTGLSTVLEDIQAILADVDSTFVVAFDPLVTDARDPVQVWEEDRGAALDDLAASVDGIWMADRSGGFTVFRNPYSLVSEPPFVALIEDGVNGDIITVGATTSRSEVVNSVTVITERADGVPPIRVTVRDSAPGSITRWGGPFGKQNLVIKNPTPEDTVVATRLAGRLLQQSLAATRGLNVTTPANVLLDPGDVVAIRRDGEILPMVVERITTPIDAPGQGALSTRQWRNQGVE